MSATPSIRISPPMAAVNDRGFMHGRPPHRLQRTSATHYESESRDIILACPQLGSSSVPVANYSSTIGLPSHQLQPPVEAPSLLGEDNITLALALTRDEEGLLAFCEASAFPDNSNRRLPSLASVPPPRTTSVSSLSSTLASAVPLQEDEPCRECPGAPILDDPDPPYHYGTHPFDMIPLFPRRHPGATSLAGVHIATPSWVQPSSMQTMSTVTDRRSVTPIAPSLSGSSASTCVPRQVMRRNSPASGEMSSLLLEADRVPLFPSAPRASRGPSSLCRRYA